VDECKPLNGGFGMENRHLEFGALHNGVKEEEKEVRSNPASLQLWYFFTTYVEPQSASQGER
jgi:hypothetical protein